MTENCEACAVSVHLSGEEIRQMFGSLAVKNVKLVTEDVYGARLNECMRCDALMYGTTCRHCGCVVQVKAKLAGARCPFPYQRKW